MHCDSERNSAFGVAHLHQRIHQLDALAPQAPRLLPRSVRCPVRRTAGNPATECAARSCRSSRRSRRARSAAARGSRCSRSSSCCDCATSSGTRAVSTSIVGAAGSCRLRRRRRALSAPSHREARRRRSSSASRTPARPPGARTPRGAARRPGRAIARWISANDDGASSCGSDCSCALRLAQLAQLAPSNADTAPRAPRRGIHGLAVAQAQQMVDRCVHGKDSDCGSSSSRRRWCARASCDLEKLAVRPIRRAISPCV